MHVADVLKTYGDNRKVKRLLRNPNLLIIKENTVKWYKNSHLF